MWVACESKQDVNLFAPVFMTQRMHYKANLTQSLHGHAVPLNQYLVTSEYSMLYEKHLRLKADIARTVYGFIPSF